MDWSTTPLPNIICQNKIPGHCYSSSWHIVIARATLEPFYFVTLQRIMKLTVKSIVQSTVSFHFIFSFNTSKVMRKLQTRPALTWTAVSTIIGSHQQALGNLTNKWTPVGFEPSISVVELFHSPLELRVRGLVPSLSFNYLSSLP